MTVASALVTIYVPACDEAFTASAMAELHGSCQKGSGLSAIVHLPLTLFDLQHSPGAPFLYHLLIPSHRKAPHIACSAFHSPPTGWLYAGLPCASVGRGPDMPLPQGPPFTLLAIHPGMPGALIVCPPPSMLSLVPPLMSGAVALRCLVLLCFTLYCFAVYYCVCVCVCVCACACVLLGLFG